MARPSTATRHKVVKFHQQGLSQIKISKQTGVSQCAVQALLKRHKETGNTEAKQTLCSKWKTDQAYFPFEIVRYGYNHLLSMEVWPEVFMEAAKKPFIRHEIKAKLLGHAQEHRNWRADKWQQVLWTDESKLEMLGCSRRQFVHRRIGKRYTNECLQATMKLGWGSLWVRVSISAANGLGDLVRTIGVLNAEKYSRYLSIPSGRCMIGPKCILHQDIQPKHTANVIKNYLQCKEDQEALEVKVWTQQSPDVNIIQSIWDYMKRKVDLRKPAST